MFNAKEWLLKYIVLHFQINSNIYYYIPAYFFFKDIKNILSTAKQCVCSVTASLLRVSKEREAALNFVSPTFHLCNSFCLFSVLSTAFKTLKLEDYITYHVPLHIHKLYIHYIHKHNVIQIKLTIHQMWIYTLSYFLDFFTTSVNSL